MAWREHRQPCGSKGMAKSPSEGQVPPEGRDMAIPLERREEGRVGRRARRSKGMAKSPSEGQVPPEGRDMAIPVERRGIQRVSRRACGSKGLPNPGSVPYAARMGRSAVNEEISGQGIVGTRG